jgi:hypothetical protein
MTSSNGGPQSSALQTEKKDRLKKSVSQLACIPETDLIKMTGEIEFHSDLLPWKSSYGEYQSGNWKTVTLMNPCGDMSQNEIYDGTGRATEILDLLPATRKYAEGLNLKVMWLRIAKLGSNSYLWEHVDYRELNNSRRVRLHLPLVSDSGAFFSFPEFNVHLKRGFLWKLDPTHRHGAANVGVKERIHLLFDCYIDEQLENLIKNEWLDSEVLFEKGPPVLRDADRDKLLRLGHSRAVVDQFLKSFHLYDLGGKSSYDLLAEYFSGDPSLSQHWSEKRELYIGKGVKE